MSDAISGDVAAALVERIAKMLHEPLVMDDGCAPLDARLVEAVNRLLRRNHSLEKSEDELRILRAAWAPVVHAAVMQSVSLSVTEGDFVEYRLCCDATESAAKALTMAQQQEAEPT